MSRLLNIQQTAEMMGDTPVATLRFWRHAGLGPKSARLGRRIYYREEDVKAWIDAQFEDEGNSRVSV